MADLKQSAVAYVPVKDDPTDTKLANYINNYPDKEKLRIKFQRESEGVYRFGSKKVIVKVEKDRIKIRVGGGYLSIDQFLEQYTPPEIEKRDRSDPLRKLVDQLTVYRTLMQSSPNGRSARTDDSRSPTRRS